ncbi:MAG: HEAT repeat domain-containing protein [Pseudomonadota bacterium]
MNCQDLNHLLDATTEDLTPAQRESIDRHLNSCPSCSEDWANWREMGAMPIPATPAALHGRIAAALRARFATPERPFRPFLIGTLLLVGAVAVAAVVLQYAQRDAGPVVASAEFPAAPAVPGVEEPALQLPAAADKPPELLPATAVVAADIPLDPHTVVVVRRPEAAADARTIMLAGRCHDAILNQLRAIKGLHILADAAVAPHEGNSQPRLGTDSGAAWKLTLSDQGIARKLGAGNVMVMTTTWGCSAAVFNTETGGLIAGQTNGGGTGVSDWEPFARSLTKSVGEKILLDDATLSADARTTVLDATRSESDRIGALSKLADKACQRTINSMRCTFDKDIIAAAVQLGTKSSSASTRVSAWVLLRGSADPDLVPPLLQALAGDSDTTVRMQAATSLNSYLDVPGVRDALLRAAAQDSSREPEVVCCIMSVREAAQRAAVSDADFRSWVQGTLYDETLPARARLVPVMNFSPDNRFMTLSISDFGADAARVVFDIGQYEQNPQVRRMAWQVLQRAAPNEAFVPVLLADMTTNPDQGVRSSAAQILERHSGNPEVRKAFERALQDSSMEVRAIAMRVTGTSGN